MGMITALKFPLKLLVGLVRRRRKRVINELAKKQLKHVRNFAPTHYSWQKSLGKDKCKKRKNNKNFRKRGVKKIKQ
jgi:hypothetical protein